MAFDGVVLGRLYATLAGGVGLGVVLGRWLSPAVSGAIGQGLFWVGVPLSCVAFLRQTDLSGQAWLAPLVAWGSIGLAGLLAWGWLHGSQTTEPKQRASFWLGSMFGNTGYLGFPIALALVGQSQFAWALFFDVAGTTLGAYGVGSALAARLGGQSSDGWGMVRAGLINPTVWGVIGGLLSRSVALPGVVDRALMAIAWGVVALALVLIGMRLSRLRLGAATRPALALLAIKMAIVPLVSGLALRSLGWDGPVLLVLVLQMAMPPAFACLVIAEAYDLDRDLAVSSVALGTVALPFTLPLWLWLFGSG